MSLPAYRAADPARTYFAYNGAWAFLSALTFTLSMVYYVRDAGLDPLQMVLVGTTLELACFLFEIPTGIVADLYSRRLSVIIGVALIGAGFLLQGLVPAFLAILAAQVLWGLGYTFTSGADYYGQLREDVLETWAAWDLRFGIVKQPIDVGSSFDRGLAQP